MIRKVDLFRSIESLLSSFISYSNTNLQKEKQSLFDLNMEQKDSPPLNKRKPFSHLREKNGGINEKDLWPGRSPIFHHYGAYGRGGR